MLSVTDTAYPIAVVRADEAELPPGERLFEDPYAPIFRAAGAHADEGTQRFLGLPFFRDGIRLRTRFLDDAVRDAIAAGLRQLVLLGAGFDMRGVRLPEVSRAGVRVFEVDFDAQLQRKRALLEAAGEPPTSFVRYVACDFSAPGFDVALEGDLTRAGFRAGEGAVFVWEGVIGYIELRAIEQSFALMARVGGPGTRVAFTSGDGSFAPDTAQSLTARAGFSSVEELGLDEVWRRYLPGAPHENAWVSRVGVARV